MRRVSMILAGAALLAGMPALAKDAAATRAALAEKAQAKLAKALEGRVAGAPVRCINLRNVRSSTVIDGTAILYDMGGTIYVNRPDIGASSLDDDDVLVTRTPSTQLCDLDVVRLIDRSTRFETGFVGLGKFVPYTRAKVASAK